MIIYPDIELLDGKCVTLVRGKFDDPKFYDVDPLERAKEFAAAGAQWIHVVDLDGVKQGGRHNAEIITEIIDTVDIPVQVAGGIRTMASIEWWVKARRAWCWGQRPSWIDGWLWKHVPSFLGALLSAWMPVVTR